MIPPINSNLTTKANLEPIPKPKNTIGFRGAEEVISKAKETKQAAEGVVNEKAVPFVKSVFAKVKDTFAKVKAFKNQAVEWVKKINISGKLESAKNFFKNLDIAKWFSKTAK